MATSLRFLVVVALFCSGSMSFAGSFFGPGPWGARGCFWPIGVVSGTYQHSDASRTITLQVGLDRFANLRVFEQKSGREDVSASGVILIPALMPDHVSSKDWPADGFVFKGVSDVDGSVLIRKYRATWRQVAYSEDQPNNSANEIMDITDPANPITLSRQEEPTGAFPWTATSGVYQLARTAAFIAPFLIFGWVVGRYSAKRATRRPKD